MQPTRILIGYDGSECADAALNDLSRCGLPAQVDAVVLTVSEQWVPELSLGDDVAVPPIGAADDAAPGHEPRIESGGLKAFHEAERIAGEGAARVKAMFPSWNVRGEARANGPAWGILEAAHGCDTDLIVVGSHGRRALARLVLGSVSQKVLTEASCSVRVSRTPFNANRSDVRIVIGLDGSEHALAAVVGVAGRTWPSGVSVRLLSVVSNLLNDQAASDDLAAIDDDHRDAIVAQVATARMQLEAAGIDATLVIRTGDPASTLIREALEWDADAIVVGARGHDMIESMMVGSVSSKIVARAHCSVEVDRTDVMQGGGE